MRSIKPGRGPSFMGAMTSVVIAIFGIIWTIATSVMGAPFIFPIFGVVFVIIAIVQGIYHFTNATGKNRFSTFDITDSSEESDPFSEMINKNHTNTHSPSTNNTSDVNFCPYCGKAAQADYEFCSGCGKKI